MDITIIDSYKTENLDLLVVFVFENGKIPNLDFIEKGYSSRIVTNFPECGKKGNIKHINITGCSYNGALLVVGGGKEEEFNSNGLRCLAAAAIRSIDLTLPHKILWMVDNITSDFDINQVFSALIEGMILGAYKFNYYKSVSKRILARMFILYTEKISHSVVREVVSRSQIVAESVNYVRDLVNHPANYMTPSKMALEASNIANETGMEVTILSSQELAEKQMNALLAVAQGSKEEARLIVLRYIGSNSDTSTVAFVGKGVTFDSGGISLKSSANMAEMKGDMAGGAAVLGAMRAIARLKLRCNIIGIIPCVENMPSGCATRPGDIVKTMSGKTVEIINTDAEGRLILADALWYASELGATHIVDIATLTGACEVALGNVAAGVMTNNNDWCKRLLQAADDVGEKMWCLPTFSEYREQIESDVADLKNTGGRMAGVITAGLFLREFVNDIPWIHIDIAGTANSDKSRGCNVKGATGYGVRTLVRLAELVSV